METCEAVAQFILQPQHTDNHNTLTTFKAFPRESPECIKSIDIHAFLHFCTTSYTKHCFAQQATPNFDPFLWHWVLLLHHIQHVCAFKNRWEMKNRIYTGAMISFLVFQHLDKMNVPKELEFIIFIMVFYRWQIFVWMSQTLISPSSEASWSLLNRRSKQL